MDSIQSFKEKLDNEHHWPSVYMFKFIVPKGKEDEVKQLFPGKELSTKSSRKGNYISVTAEVFIQSSNEVIQIYQKAHLIEGIISL